VPDPYVHVTPSTFDALAGGEQAPLSPEDDHHVRRVLRLGVGADLVLSDGRGREAPARLTAEGVVLTGDVVVVQERSPRLHVVQALAKSRKVDEVIRSVTELGVSAVTVVAADRSVVALSGPKTRKVQDRWHSIARSAAGQSRRAHLPEVQGPVSVEEVAAGVGDRVVGLVAEVAARTGLRTALMGAGRVADPHEVRIAIGPEGGWSDDELAVFDGAGWVAVTLSSSSVLRTEHAGLVASAGIAALMGWMD